MRPSPYPPEPQGTMFWLPAVLFSWYLVSYVLLPIPAVRPGMDVIDDSWRAFLGWAFENHKQFGTEVIFTYGPWGFLMEPRGTIGLYSSQVLGRLVLAIAVCSGVTLLGVSWIRSVTMRWIWAGTIVILAEPAILIPVLLFVGTMPSSVEFRWKRPVLALIAFAAGLAACTKFSCFLLVAILLPLLFIRKGLVIFGSIVVASFLLFWRMAGQEVSNLPAFVRQSMEISNGYGSAMVTGRPWIELPLALLVCGLPLLQLTGQLMPLINLEKLGRLGWLAVCEFLIFRHGLIRADPAHWYMAFLTIGVPIVTLLLALPGGPSLVWPSCWKASYSILLVGALTVTLSSAHEEIGYRASRFLESVRLYPVYARELASLRVRERAASGGTVDVFPYQLSYAIQKGLTLRNRPVIQAYSAYTGNLSKKNAEFLWGFRGKPNSVPG